MLDVLPVAPQLHGTLPIDLSRRVRQVVGALDSAAAAAEVDAVLDQLRWVLVWFNGEGVVVVNRTLEHLHPGDRSCPPFVLQTTVLLLLARQNGLLELVAIGATPDDRDLRRVRDVIDAVAIASTARDCVPPIVLATTLLPEERRVVASVVNLADVRNDWLRVLDAAAVIEDVGD